MEQDIKFGRSRLKVYDIVVLALIAISTILVAVVSGVFQLNISPAIIAFIAMGAEMFYIFGVVNKRK